MAEQNFQHIIPSLQNCISDRNIMQSKLLLEELYPADIAELLQEFSVSEQKFLLDCIDNEISSSVLLELDEDERGKLLESFSAKEIAEEMIQEMDSDDAADIISELSEDKKEEVIAHIDDEEHASSIVDLLKYNEDTAGGIMAKELIKVNESWSVLTSVKEMRKQAESQELDEVYSIYVVDDKEKLLGLLNLKKLLTTSTNSQIAQVYNPKIHKVSVQEDAEDVARMMQKYDLFEVPVVDELNRLVGRITIDDVIDVITDEAEKDYQMASGISTDVDHTDSYWALTKARLPWLVIGMVGGLIGSRILQSNQDAMQEVPMLIFFVPLIAATAGNVGVQSSAIVVQGLANGSLKGENIFKNLKKELLVALITGMSLSLCILLFNIISNHANVFLVPVTISLALFAAILNASIIGTMVPLILEKKGIDPAIATGPFITTSNDILGILIYFLIAKAILGL